MTVEKLFVYTVEVPDNLRISDLLEMLRYSDDEVLAVSTFPRSLTLCLRKRMIADDEDHINRRLKFFKGYVLGRWGSFGCKVSDVREIEPK